jgi:TetR/AcrR family transcriptional repressor of mexJK operon
MVNKRSKNEAKRQQILDSAINLFTEQGYAAASMDLIAKNADVSKQTVYSHFGSKDDLFSASIEHICESLHILDLSMDDLSDAKRILLQLAQRFTEVITSKQACAAHKICAFESNAYPQVSDIFYQAAPLKVTNEVAILMKKLHQQKILHINNPRHAAIQFLNMMKGELWMQIEFNTKERITAKEVQKYLHDSVEFFIRGYAIK